MQVSYNGRKAILTAYFDQECLMFNKLDGIPPFDDKKIFEYPDHPDEYVVYTSSMSIEERRDILFQDSDGNNCICKIFGKGDLPRELAGKGYVTIIGNDPLEYDKDNEFINSGKTVNVQCNACGQKYKVNKAFGYRSAYYNWQCLNDDLNNASINKNTKLTYSVEQKNLNANNLVSATNQNVNADNKKSLVSIQNDYQLEKDKVVQATVGIKTVYLYLLRDKNVEEYSVYNVSENTYKNILRGQKIKKDEEEYLGNMNINQDIALWIEKRQKEDKIFGKIKDNSKKKVNSILGILFLIGLVLLGVGAWRVYCKNSLETKAVETEGEIVKYTTARLVGKRSANGYYNVYVRYTVDGKSYEGYNGKTATKQNVGDHMVVKYDPKHPSYIFIGDEMAQYTFIFFLIGGVIAVVSGVMLLAENTKVIK